MLRSNIARIVIDLCSFVASLAIFFVEFYSGMVPECSTCTSQDVPPPSQTEDPRTWTSRSVSLLISGTPKDPLLVCHDALFGVQAKVSNFPYACGIRIHLRLRNSVIFTHSTYRFVLENASLGI
jgi:hypothetical protein